jgi:preprotein translocase subunit SecD
MLRAVVFVLALAALPQAAGAQSLQLNVVQESLELKPGDIVGAEAVQQHGQWAISIKLAPGAAAMFGAVTGRSVGKRVQIVVEDRILSAPIVREAITGGEVMISGNLTEEDARALAARIRR